MFLVVSAIFLCDLVFPWPVLANPLAYHSQQYYFLDKNGGYNYGHQISDANTEKPFSVGDREKFSTTNNEGRFNYSPQGRFLPIKLPTTSTSGGNSNVDPTNVDYFDNFDSQKLGRNLHKNTHSGEDIAKPIGIFIPKQNGAFFVTYTVGDQTNQKGPNREVSTEQYLDGDDTTETGEETPEMAANTGDASYRFIIDTDDYKREEESDAFGNVKGHFSYKNEAGTHDLSYKAGGDTGFVATGGTLANPYNQTTPEETEEESSPDNVQKYSPNTLNGDSTKITHRDDSGVFINTDDYQRHEISDENGNFRGYFFYKTNPAKGATWNKPPQEPFLWENFGKKTTKGGKLAPPKPVPYPQSKTAYGVNNYVVHTYLPPQKEKFGYIILAD